MLTEVLVMMMMVTTVTIACLWTNCQKDSAPVQGQYTVPGNTFQA